MPGYDAAMRKHQPKDDPDPDEPKKSRGLEHGSCPEPDAASAASEDQDRDPVTGRWIPDAADGGDKPGPGGGKLVCDATNEELLAIVADRMKAGLKTAKAGDPRIDQNERALIYLNAAALCLKHAPSTVPEPDALPR